METNVEDPELNKLLDSDIPINNERNTSAVEGEEFNLSEDENLDTPISEHTKNMIASLLFSSATESPELTVKIVNILKSLEGLTEKEGLCYIKAIQTSDMTQINCQAITLILRSAVNTFFSPNYPEERKIYILKDKYIRASLSNILSDVFYKLGYWSGAILFFLFALESYNFPFIDNKDVTSSTDSSV